MKVIANKIIFITLLATIMLCAEAYAQAKHGKVTTVVLDAGHGGKDPGTVWGNYREKDIALQVALELGKLIRSNLPDVKVVYTRDKDVFVPLIQRSEIANKAGADLFISIHVNAVDKGVKSPSGALTLVMGAHNEKANLDVAMRENDVICYEEDYSTTYEGYIPGSTESFIIFSLMQYAHLDQSMTFANMIQSHYRTDTPMPDKGVRQQGVLVLWKTAMPSVLTELGFITNEHDRAVMTSASGQKKLARGLFNAFSRYKGKVEGKSHILLDAGQDRTAAAASESAAAAAGQGEQVAYRIQLCSSAKPLKTNNPQFGSFRGRVTEKKIGGTYKYYTGYCTNYKDAAALQAKVRREIKDAFMVAFQGDRQLSIAQARKLTE